MILGSAVGRLGWVLVCVTAFVACVPAWRSTETTRVSGIRFSVDSSDSPSPAQNVLGALAGVVEFGRGRGRFDVASNFGRAVSINGVVVARPLIRAGDYYLFDSAGFVLVQPHDRTFSVFHFARSWMHLGNARDPTEGFMEFVGLRADTLPQADPANLRQHGPFTVRWHVDRRRSGNPPIDVLCRGWLDVADAPAGDASVVRWFGAGAALYALSTATDSLQGADLQLTTAVVLNARGQSGPLNLIVLHPIHDLAHAEIEASRLVLPAGFAETMWPGFEHEMTVPTKNDDVVARWRRIPDTAGK
jgi:hypothetical protein